MIVIPIGSYFLSVNAIFKGISPPFRPHGHARYTAVAVLTSVVARKFFIRRSPGSIPGQRGSGCLRHCRHERRPIRKQAVDRRREQKKSIVHPGCPLALPSFTLPYPSSLRHPPPLAPCSVVMPTQGCLLPCTCAVLSWRRCRFVACTTDGALCRLHGTWEVFFSFPRRASKKTSCPAS